MWIVPNSKLANHLNFNFNTIIMEIIMANFKNKLHKGDHGLWKSRASFFWKSPLFWLGQANWAENLRGIRGIFSQFNSTHFGILCFPCKCFFIDQESFLQKKNTYISKSYIFMYLGLGFEFGPQRVMDLATMFL